jgi:drug/metabolite transporter (DMT)-like permease
MGGPPLRDSNSGHRDFQLAVLFIILDVLFWGFSFISTKVVLSQIPPISIAFFRQLIAATTLVLLVLYTRTPFGIARKDLGNIVAASFFGIVMYFVFENSGLQYTTASNASMIVASLPIFTLFGETMFFKLKVTWKMIFSLILSMIGVVLVVTVNGKVDLSSARFFGNLLVMGAIICWVIYTILNRRLSDKYRSLAITTYQSMISIFLFLPFIVPEMKRWPAASNLSMPVLANLIFLGVFCSGFAYIFYIYAVRRLGATISSAFLNLVPVVTVFCGYVLLDETLSWIQILGMALIMAALYSLNRLVPRPASTSKN